MDDMDVWKEESPSPPDEGAEVATFENAFGETETEEMQSIPPPDAHAKGTSAANSFRLAAHTGTQHVRGKGDDVPMEDLFDRDLFGTERDATSLAAERSRVQIDLNRKGMQPSADAAAFSVSRDEMYHGYNETLPRTLRGLIPTRRGEQSLYVEGHEVSPRYGVPAAAAAPPATMRVGALDRLDQDDSMARASAVGSRKVATGAPSTLGVGGMTALSLPNRQEAERGSMPTSQHVLSASHPFSHAEPHRRLTHPSARASSSAARSGAVVGSADSVAAPSDGGPRDPTLDGASRSAASSSPALGHADSVEARTPVRLSYDESAAAAAALAIGARDSSVADSAGRHDRAGVADNPTSRPHNPDHADPLRRGALDGSSGRATHESEYTRAARAVRARDSRADSRAVERMVADRMERHAAAAAAQARTARSDAARAREGPRAFETSAAAAAAHLIGASTALDLRDAARRAAPRRDLVASVLRALGMSRDGSQGTVEARTGGRSADVGAGAAGAAFPVASSTADVRWGDDGTMSSSHRPLSSGPDAGRVLSQVARLPSRLSTLASSSSSSPRATFPRSASVPPPLSSSERIGTRA